MDIDPSPSPSSAVSSPSSSAREDAKSTKGQDPIKSSTMKPNDTRSFIWVSTCLPQLRELPVSNSKR
ncbi:hypothetical protein RJ640_007307 [Escallonia rubra]|uniref:Uncharacterized protein n=1 Tax=Escallonia rubra TaxID=112253 RepID=A0AA88RG80_9ASTE|nr:hypothetical protein RJ640_007307 [Escallonia rubra]